MIALSHKSKHYGLIALKVLILSLTFGYIYQKLHAGANLNVRYFIQNITDNSQDGWPWWILFICMAGVNWLFEILKWRTVVSPIKIINFKEAMRQSLAGLTVSLATPNRIGDYGAKAIYYPRNEQKQILLVNFFSNTLQMMVTTVLGGVGLLMTASYFNFSFSPMNTTIVLLAVALISVFAYQHRTKEIMIQGLTVNNIIRYFRKIPRAVKIKTTCYSLLRYIVFSSLFFLLLKFFNAPISLGTAMPIIFVMYLLVSIIPSLFILDVVVRGGVALWLFSQVGVSEITILSTILAMWLLNFVLPAIWGSFYVITFKRV